MRLIFRYIIFFYVGVLSLCSGFSVYAESPQIHYQVTFEPKTTTALIEVTIPESSWLSKVRFRPLPNTHGDVTGNGEITEKGHYVHWVPPERKARLHYRVKLDVEREGGGYDALVTPNWGLMRGEDLFPSFLTTKKKGVKPEVDIRFVLPEGWTSVNSGWERKNGRIFAIPGNGRGMPRPPGWIIAGDLGTRHENMGRTQISISAPKGHDFRQMEALAFLGMVWPEFSKAIDKLPEKILITGAGDPMWRGGLSSPMALYIHSDRPLVSENGTSTVLHELIHVITGTQGGKNSDWIVEGIAEYYSVELLYRAGAYSQERRQAIFAGLAEWGKDVDSLLRRSSYGPYTARAAVLFNELDKEIQSCGQKKNKTVSLDIIVNAVADNKSVELKDIQRVFRDICDRESEVLKSPLLAREKS